MDSLVGMPPDHLDAPYAERWGLLKDVMARLYLDEKKIVKQIVEIMIRDYRFYASEPQYKRQFGLWNFKKALSTKKKVKISKVLETRAQQGKSSVVLHQGKAENHKMRRYMKEQARRNISLGPSLGEGDAISIENLFGHALQCGNRVFLNWSMPAAVMHFLRAKAMDHVSPRGFSDTDSHSDASVGTPMSGIVVATPPSGAGPSPRNPPSLGHALSPGSERSAMTLAAQEGLKVNRSHLLIQKHQKELLRGMNPPEQHTVVDWMHQFWQFSFTTARTWGRGPRSWNSTSLRFQDFSTTMIESVPGTPAMNANSPTSNISHPRTQERSPKIPVIQRPSPLCRWSIHIGHLKYERIQSPPPSADIIDPTDEDSWEPWAEPEGIKAFAESLQHNLESNGFSTIGVADLPISSGQISRAVKRSPTQMLEEAFGFSIMAGNLNLVVDMIDEMVRNSEDFSFNDLYPLHLASSYLDGSRTCCLIFDEIMMGMATGEVSVRKLYTNHLNHTVLDNLMIAILKGHTSCAPFMVDEALKKEARFAGEEVDICGRWDGDSDCVRHLQAGGHPTVPLSWKHMFCHTSVQAITHCMGTLFGPHWKPDINTPSGLFVKRCMNEGCGRKLQLTPLHALVITAVYLAQLGSEGETLFGMVACLLCLLGRGADPVLKAHVSPMALLSNEVSQECSHFELDPWELSQSVPQELISNWPEERRVGWNLFCAVLQISRDPIVEPVIPEPTAQTLDHAFQIIYSESFKDGDQQSMHGEVQSMDLDGDQREEEKEEEEEEEEEEESGSEREYDDESFDPVKDKGCGCIDHESTSYEHNIFTKSKALSTLWTAVQTELLSYRRIAEGDPWISTNFDMRSALESLQTGRELSIGLSAKNMMKLSGACGVFIGSEDPVCPRVDEACAYYFSNLEDWSRSTFLGSFEARLVDWEAGN